MARPLRFRHAPGTWSEGRVRSEVLDPLDANLGATAREPRAEVPSGWQGRRFDVDNGDVAMFCWTDDEAYWVGNTETPSPLWQTEKVRFEAAPDGVAAWAQRELLVDLLDDAPWLRDYPHVAWFFLPVFLSKDGRESSRTFFREHAAGFPDAEARAALTFYEDLLETGALDDDRYTMASKLGTSGTVAVDRMSAAMSEFNAARLLLDAGCDLVPEADVSTGHSIDFEVDPPSADARLVEVTRPTPPARRSVDDPVTAVRETAAGKANGQLAAHGGGVTLFVDCSGFDDEEWAAVQAAEPGVHHRPAVVFRARPDGEVERYTKGSVPLPV
ncbi:MAG: DUF5784 family protein [Halobacteriaceae archaeon]